MRKLYSKVTFPELQSSVRGYVGDEVEARAQDDMDELTTKYYRAKWDFYCREKMAQFKVSMQDIEETALLHGGPDGKDEMMKRRAEFMYNYMDYDNDRARVR